jgi:O-antigen ligase
MTTRAADHPIDLSSRPGFISRASWFVIIAALFVIPLFVGTDGKDGFRQPKDVLFIAAAALLVIAGAMSTFRRRAADGDVNRLRTVPVIALAVVSWTAVTALLSANRPLSLSALVWVVAAAAFAVAIDIAGRMRRVEAMAWCLVPAIINAGVFLIQRFHLGNPIHFPADVPEHFRYTALVGNPDDVSSFLVAPAIAAVALALSQSKRRIVWIIAAVPLLAAVATGQLTGIIACAAALIVMGFMRSRRIGLSLATATLLAAVVLVAGYSPIRQRAVNVASSIKRHDYAEAFSGRVTPFLAAANMAVRHPVFGVGPGVFRWEFFPYKLEVEHAHPHLARAYSSAFNFGEVHDEYLQSLAETGFVGGALLVVALFTIARSSFRGSEESDRDVLVRTLGLPLAVAVAVLCVAQFPLHISAPLLILIYVCVLCVSWGPVAELPVPAGRLGRTITSLMDRRVPRWAAVVATVAAVSVGWVVFERMCYWPYVCNVRKNAVYDNTTLMRRAADKYSLAPIARSNLVVLDRCIQGNPLDIDLYMLKAANYRALGLNEEAARAYETALAYDRRPELYYSLGVVELDMNRRPQALQHLLLAVRFSRQYLEDLPTDVQADLMRTLKRDFPYLAGT